MDSLEKRLDAVLADRRKRILASLPVEEAAEMYRRMKAEQRQLDIDERDESQFGFSSPFVNIIRTYFRF